MWDKVKSFYQRRRDLVWLLVAIIIVLAIVNDWQPRNLLTSKSSPSYGIDMMNSDAMMEESPSLARDSSYMPTPGYGSEPGQVAGQEEKIRKNAYLNVEVDKADYSQTKTEVDGLMSEYQGFYVNKNEYVNTYNNADYYTYTITLKFAKDNFDSILEEFKALGDIKNFSVDATDLTTQYYDTVAYKESAEAIKARVQALLGQTNNINEIITIETKLADLQRQIDSYQRQITNLDRQTEYSQLTLTVSEKLGYAQSFYEFTKLRDLFRNTVKSVDNLFVLVSKLLGYLIILLIIWGGYRLGKRIRLRKQQKINN